MFDPTIGRWLEQDPIGFDAGDANLYRYVGNGPTNGVDPTGFESEDDDRRAPKAKEALAVQEPSWWRPSVKPNVSWQGRPDGGNGTPYQKPPSKPLGSRPTGKPTVVAGHGIWHFENGYAQVPPGVTMTLFVPSSWTLGNEFAETVIDPGHPGALDHYWETFGPGELLPNYTLYPPEGGTFHVPGRPGAQIGFGPITTGPGAMTFSGPVNIQTLMWIQSFLFSGQPMFWSACAQHDYSTTHMVDSIWSDFPTVPRPAATPKPGIWTAFGSFLLAGASAFR